MNARKPASPATRRITLPTDAGGVVMAVHEHGPRSGRPVVCVHGLTRNGRDFDWLGAALAGRGRYVLAPDMPGRGSSGWLDDASGYATGAYIRAVLAMLRARDLASVDWVGTSMGGIIGMAMASLPGSPIRRLVLNDVGAVVPKAALEAIAAYVGLDPHFGSLDDAERYIRETHAGFGALTDAQWRWLTCRSLRRDGAGYRLRYDPAIRTPFVGTAITDVELWQLYDAIRCPVLLLRGASSALFPASVAREMTARGPKAKLIEIAGAGHAPALMDETQIDAVAAFLR